MDDFVGVHDVIDSERLKVLSERSDWKGLLQLGSHLGALGVCTVTLSLTWGTFWMVPFFVLQGVLINFLFACQHECNHNTAFATRWLNLWVSRCAGFVLLYPCDYEKLLHFAHHRHTQVDGKDPELMLRPPFVHPGPYLWMMSGLPFFIGRVKSLFRHASAKVADWYLSEPQRNLVIRAARWHLLGYALIFVVAVSMHSWWPVTMWLAPYMCTKWVYWIQGLQEHLGLTHAPNTLLNTRTSKTNWFMRWLNWNMTYHTVHHTFPAVPFHALRKLHAEVAAVYPQVLPVNTYWEFHWGLLRSLMQGRTEPEMVASADQRFAEQ